MTVLQSIQKGFGESKKLITIAAIFFAFNLIIGLVMLPFAGPESAGDPQIAGVAWLITIISLLGFIFLQGGALASIRDMIKKNSFSLADFVQNGKKYYLNILILFLVIIVIAVVVVAVFALITAGLLAVVDNGLIRALIAALGTILAIFASVCLLFPIYAIVVDEAGPIVALKKGFSISMANFSKTLLLLVALFIVTFIIAFIIGLLSAVIAVIPVIGQILTLAVNSAVQSYLSVVMMTALMAYYLSLNVAEKGQEQDRVIPGPETPNQQ